MNALYKGKKVKVLKVITGKYEYITKPVIIQVKIEYKEGKDKYDAYVDPNEIKFI